MDGYRIDQCLIPGKNKVSLFAIVSRMALESAEPLAIAGMQ
jgi:hypothetical protein